MKDHLDQKDQQYVHQISIDTSYLCFVYVDRKFQIYDVLNSVISFRIRVFLAIQDLAAPLVLLVILVRG